MLFSVIGCQSDENETKQVVTTSIELELSTLKKGDNLNQLVTPYNYIIRTSQQWNEFKDRVKVFGSFTNIDFTNMEVIVVFDTPRQSYGHEIEITTVTKVNGTLVV